MHFVRCGCGARGPEEGNETQAIAAWNTRTPDPEAAAEIEGLRRAVENLIFATKNLQAVRRGDGGTAYHCDEIADAAIAYASESLQQINTEGKRR